MKIQLDTKAKTIKVEEDVNLNELFVALNKLFPNKEWKEFKLLVGSVIYWSNPLIIDRWPVNPWPTYPWITCDTSGTVTNKYDTPYTLTAGVFNVEMQ
jgi:hypothetical protein